MAADPLVWILWRRRKGDLDQMLALVTALGWRHKIKRLSFHGPDVPALANLLLNRGSDSLAPPWPDIVLCAEALPSIVARKLKSQSRGAIRAVCIGRPAGTPDAFDLVITTPQYRISQAPNVVELSMPVSMPLAAVARPAYEFSGKGPLITVLVGGSSFPDVLDGRSASQLARDIRLYADKFGGTLAVATSPRTSREVVEALKANISAHHRLHVFGEGGDHYRAALHAADEVIVTSDSVSMVADALDTGKPVSIYPLPRQLNLQWRISEWLYAHAMVKPSPMLAPFKWAFDRGVFEASADRRLLFGKLVARGQVSWFGSPAPTPNPEASRQDMARAVERLRALLA
jgi:mitochondrial fission protein ELM1